MGGKSFPVGRIPHEFRVQLYMEHLGEEDPSVVADPLEKKFLDKMRNDGKSNTNFYRKVFRAEPDDHQTSFQALKKDREAFLQTPMSETLEMYNKLKDNVKGNYVEYPTEYLRDAPLELQATNLAKLVPAKNFV